MGSCVRIAKQDSNQPIINASLSRQIPSFSPVQGLHNNNIDLGITNMSSFINYTNNCIYEGDSDQKNHRHGKGTLKWPDGTYYVGDWVTDKATGTGSLYFVHGDLYSGNFRDNKFEGFGKYVNSKGVVYEGEWKENLQNGQGLESFSDGTKFEGNYSNGKKNGLGKIKFSDGSIYEGNFVDNNIEGFGKLTWPPHENKIYEGFWKNNIMDGKGKMLWLENGKSYEGNYLEDKKHGFGIFTWNNGDKWIGYWRKGNRHGKGVLVNREKRVKEKGEWEDGKKIRDYGVDEFIKGFEDILERSREEG